jgi:hypothetical protein
MSFSHITPYFKNAIGSLNKFKYVSKPFDQSIPSTILDRSYTIVFDRFSGVGRNMIDFQVVATVYVYLYRKGYQYEEQAREAAAIDSEAIVKASMNYMRAYGQPIIKNVLMKSIDIEAFPSNDNTVASRLTFDVTLRIDPNN